MCQWSEGRGAGGWVEVGKGGESGDICNSINNKHFFFFKKEQDNLWTGPKATLCPKALFAKKQKSRNYDYWADDYRLKFKKLFRMSITMLCFLH